MLHLAKRLVPETSLFHLQSEQRYFLNWLNENKQTRVFAYYASPATLDAAYAKDKTFPAVVLVHGGGGTAFDEWAELWAKRGDVIIGFPLRS